ncbi:arginine--tRNA ligase [Verrucomicrobiaceae bacterium N1E253]|uniref:Arginine--tRNA ligase n=1 Tax=Oceaniferula marina TaxID=2748318 RepID=A0A851GHK1_9BACT|nr:arginine--tRNA ligase [Oceaniferula marina]NWK56679.1 arginine--tRNA ligase [Oceaniferula marina]
MIIEQLERALIGALESVGVELPEGFQAKVEASADLRFGDYQTNAAMVLAKRVRTNPRELATKVVEAMQIDDLAECSIAGPGFINFTVTMSAWGSAVSSLGKDERLGVPLASPLQTVVLDFSAPNVAKPMHVGHIRSTIIGDSLARIARFLGHTVITDNHIGDWGTQFGMIIHGWKTVLDEQALEADPVTELLRVYRTVNAQCGEDESIREICKQELVKLQGGDADNLKIWERCVELSKQGLQGIYDRLDVQFDYWYGESYYNERLAPLVDDMLEQGVARESEGAICVFFDGEAKLKDKPTIIRKADGGFLYATTDLATIDFRVEEWQADQIWYVVGAPQQLHFQQIFEATRMRGQNPSMHHVAFGSILGEDRKLMKTRSGDNVQLIDVLDEAVERAAKAIEEKNPDLSGEEKDKVASIVGLGAVKFAELSQHRMTDYVFCWDRMLALQGDTAPYLQYSCVRVRSIFSKLDEGVKLDLGELRIEADAEVHLARMLVRFGEVVPSLLDDFRPNLLANYLLELARAFHSFFEACPVLKSEGATQNTRLVLCDLTSQVLVKGLGLLGIEVPERM